MRIPYGTMKLPLNSFLQKSGWYKSYRKGLPTGKDGKPLIWFTYSMIKFLEERLKKDMKVFEYGSGYGSMWLRERVNTLESVEHDKQWNLTNAVLAETRSLYVGVLKFEWDIIIIDGKQEWRVECFNKAKKHLTERGVIIFDDLNNPDYKINYEGFKRLDFWGMRPAVAFEGVTTIFYKPNNCLGI